MDTVAFLVGSRCLERAKRVFVQRPYELPLCTCTAGGLQHPDRFARPVDSPHARHVDSSGSCMDGATDHMLVAVLAASPDDRYWLLQSLRHPQSVHLAGRTRLSSVGVERGTLVSCPVGTLERLQALGLPGDLRATHCRCSPGAELDELCLRWMAGSAWMLFRTFSPPYDALPRGAGTQHASMADALGCGDDEPRGVLVCHRVCCRLDAYPDK